jgi:hypothetical protein
VGPDLGEIAKLLSARHEETQLKATWALSRLLYQRTLLFVLLDAADMPAIGQMISIRSGSKRPGR